MSVRDCMYCEDGEKIKSLMTPIADLRVSRLHLLLDQSFPGRCVLALNEHHNEVDELTEKQRTDFFTDLADAVAVIRTVFKPDKVNYAIFGDQVTHFHMHLVPKYKNGALWGKPYCAEAVPEAKLSAAETAKRVEDIRAALKKGRTQK